MSFQAVVTKGTPLRVRKQESDRRVQQFNLDHQLASLQVFLESTEIANGEEWESLPMTHANVDTLINTINSTPRTGGKRSKRKRPKRKSKKLKYFFLKRK
jgi:hypothetical protein